MAERDPAEYTVEINGAECRVCLHYDCLRKIIGEYFSRKPEVTKSSIDQVTTLEYDKTWGWRPSWQKHPSQWDCGGTLNVERPSQTKVWCKADDENTHTPWKDRVD